MELQHTLTTVRAFLAALATEIHDGYDALTPEAAELADQQLETIQRVLLLIDEWEGRQEPEVRYYLNVLKHSRN